VPHLMAAARRLSTLRPQLSPDEQGRATTAGVYCTCGSLRVLAGPPA
jgi:hypothetical protein